MKKKAYQKLLDLSTDDLQELLVEKKRELLKFKVQKSQGQLNQTHYVRQNRREYAQILTLLKQRSEQSVAN